MSTRRLRGITLTETLVVVAIASIVIIAVLATWLQATKLYARTADNIEPHQSQMLALKRMEREVREAMLIDRFSVDNRVEILLPQKDANRLNVIDGTELQPGKRVCFFLGRKNQSTSGWTAVPDANGNAIFRLESASNNATNLPLASSYDNSQVEVVVEGILAIPKVADPNDPSREISTELFAFEPLNDNGTPDDPSDDYLTDKSHLVTITLTIPIARPGEGTVNSTLATKFSLRNMNY